MLWSESHQIRPEDIKYRCASHIQCDEFSIYALSFNERIHPKTHSIVLFVLGFYEALHQSNKVDSDIIIASMV